MAPVFGFFFSADEITFCNALSLVIVSAHTSKQEKECLSDVRNGKKKGSVLFLRCVSRSGNVAVQENDLGLRMNLLLNMAKESRRYGLCVLMCDKEEEVKLER